MRNFYGKWNEDRWLRSFRMFKKKPEYLKTADVRKQKYYIPLKSYKKKKHKKIIPKNWKKVPYPLVTTKKEDTPEVNYMKGVDNIMYHISNANDRREFTYIIPEEDPYLLKRNSRIDGGADVRFSMLERRLCLVTAWNFSATFRLQVKPPSVPGRASSLLQPLVVSLRI